MEQITKARIDLKEGLIELEGSEMFVTEQLNKYFDLVLAQNHKFETVITTRTTDSAEQKQQKQSLNMMQK